VINIILLSGACFSGKTHIKKAALSYYQNDFKVFGCTFAETLKKELHETGVIDKRKLSDPVYKASVRPLIQDHGKKRRAWNPDYLADKLIESIGDDFSGGATYWCDDWRMLKEEERLREAGFNTIKIRVFRPLEMKIESVGHAVVTDYLETHAKDISETELQHKYATDLGYFDFVIFNNQDGSGHLIKKFQEIENYINKGAKEKCV